MMKNKLTTFYIVRHGESVGNTTKASNHVFGKGSVLTEKGKDQARTLGSYLNNITFDEVFSSDLLRAQQTAEIIALEKNIAVKTTERLRERTLAPYFKKNPEKTREDVEKDLQKAFDNLTDAEKMAYKFDEDIESAQEATTRFITFLREIAVAYEGKTILIVCHGNLMRTLLAHLGWATYDELPQNTIKNSGFIVLESDGADMFIKQVQGATKIAKVKRGW
jgi:broad specificity phosphatase PhoE